MTSRDPPRRPTRAELAILNLLWKSGRATVREVHEALAAADSQVGYTTVLKQLQVMQRKGLVARDDQQRAHRYKPLVTRKATQRLMASDLVDSAFDGSRSGLVLELLGDARRISAEDLDEIQARIAELEARQRSRR